MRRAYLKTNTSSLCNANKIENKLANTSKKKNDANMRFLFRKAQRMG